MHITLNGNVPGGYSKMATRQSWQIFVQLASCHSSRHSWTTSHYGSGINGYGCQWNCHHFSVSVDIFILFITITTIFFIRTVHFLITHEVLRIVLIEAKLQEKIKRVKIFLGDTSFFWLGLFTIFSAEKKGISSQLIDKVLLRIDLSKVMVMATKGTAIFC